MKAPIYTYSIYEAEKGWYLGEIEVDNCKVYVHHHDRDLLERVLKNQTGFVNPFRFVDLELISGLAYLDEKTSRSYPSADVIFYDRRTQIEIDLCGLSLMAIHLVGRILYEARAWAY
jgi:hypothetical protein